jgi:hypothetical protein
MGITNQFSRPVNAKLIFTNRETLFGKYEYIDNVHYFFTEDKVFACENGKEYFTQYHPLDTSVQTDINSLGFLPFNFDTLLENPSTRVMRKYLNQLGLPPLIKVSATR